jgi:membrane protein DedA with SNARE-associated domain
MDFKKFSVLSGVGIYCVALLSGLILYLSGYAIGTQILEICGVIILAVILLSIIFINYQRDRHEYEKRTE